MSMYDEDLDTAGPYDNVEFPVRKAGTGTWPRVSGGQGLSGQGGSSSSSSGSNSTSGSGVKLYGGHQTVGRSLGMPKLAPLVEIEGHENGADVNRSHGGATQYTGGVSGGSSTQYGGGVSGVSSVSNVSGVSSSGITTPSSVLNKYSAGNAMNKTYTGSTNSGSMSNTSVNNVGVSNTSVNRVGVTTTTAGSTTNVNAMSTKSTSPTPSTASTASTTTAAKTTTTTSSSSTSSSTTKASTTTKPVITISPGTELYSPTEVGPPNGTRQKKVAEAEDEDFKRQDLNPASRRALENVYTRHGDFYQLNTKVLDEGGLLKQDVLDIYRRTGESLTYEQLIQGMLVDGERFLLGSCWLFYTHVQFLDTEGTKVLRPPYGRGRIGLTSKRAMFMTTETYTDANLEQYGSAESKTEPEGYKLEVAKVSAVVFKNIPLPNFHSAELEVITGTAAQTKISKAVTCCSCLPCFPAPWTSTPPMTRSICSRVMRLGVSMPPWQTRMYLDVHLDPTMSLTVARDFVSQLHAFAPHMH